MGIPKRKNHETKDLNPSPRSFSQGENSHKVKSVKRVLLTNVDKTQLKPHLGI
jgi:hypothetical protein